MPAWVKNDALWKKAEQVWEDMPTKERSGKDKWAYIAGIYKQMGGKVKNSAKGGYADPFMVEEAPRRFIDLNEQEFKEKVQEWNRSGVSSIRVQEYVDEWLKHNRVPERIKNRPHPLRYELQQMVFANKKVASYNEFLETLFKYPDSINDWRRHVEDHGMTVTELAEQMKKFYMGEVRRIINKMGDAEKEVSDYFGEILKNKVYEIDWSEVANQVLFNKSVSKKAVKLVKKEWSTVPGISIRVLKAAGSTPDYWIEVMHKSSGREIYVSAFNHPIRDTENVLKNIDKFNSYIKDIDWDQDEEALKESGVDDLMYRFKLFSKKAVREQTNRENWKGEMGEVDYDESTGVFELVDYEERFKLEEVRSDSDFVFFNIISLDDGRKVGVVYGDAMEGGWYTAESNGITREDKNIYLAAAKLLYNTI